MSPALFPSIAQMRTRRTNLQFVIPTGAQRSGGICSSTPGANETRECNEALPIPTSSLESEEAIRNPFHPFRKCKSKDPTFPLSSRPERSGAEGSAVSLSDGTKLANAMSHFPFHFLVRFDGCIPNLLPSISRNTNQKIQPSLCHPDRSGGICSFTFGRHETPVCSDCFPFALHHWLGGKRNDLHLRLDGTGFEIQMGNGSLHSCVTDVVTGVECKN